MIFFAAKVFSTAVVFFAANAILFRQRPFFRAEYKSVLPKELFRFFQKTGQISAGLGGKLGFKEDLQVHPLQHSVPPVLPGNAGKGNGRIPYINHKNHNRPSLFQLLLPPGGTAV